MFLLILIFVSIFSALNADPPTDCNFLSLGDWKHSSTNSSVYYCFSNDQLGSFYDANAYCRTINATLASIDSVFENRDIINLSPGRYTMWWVGLHRNNDGSWAWINGDKSQYRNWDKSKKNNNKELYYN
uniref:C-type lectin domain-containing protein n=1 Tax=Acrobeloides nanus TaxID=290746 RepID=A0A914CB58_9BILA